MKTLIHPLVICAAVSLFAMTAKAEPSADAPAPNIAAMNLGELSLKSGYTIAEIVEYFPPIEKWQSLDPDLDPLKLADTYDAARFPKPPPAGVHPRIFFGPDELPAIRRKLQDDILAKREWELIKGRLLQLSPQRSDWEDLVGSGPVWEKRRDELLKDGIRVNRRAGYHGPWVGGALDELAAGKEPESFKGKWDKSNSSCPERMFLMNLLPDEALRCLLEGDVAGGKRVAAALATICQIFTKEAPRLFTEGDWQTIHLIVSSGSIGVTYDWSHEFMTEGQRGIVRGFIAKLTEGKRSIGLLEVPAMPAATSNWTTIHMSFVPLILSIEGEEGYDETTYLAYVEGMKKWMFVASGPLGAPFEGLTKSTYAPDWALPMGKRGTPLLGSQWSINHVRKFQLGVMLPWGNEFVWENQIGLPRREVAFKYAHPQDPVVDFIYTQTADNQRLLGADANPQWTSKRGTYSKPWELPYYIETPMAVEADGSYDFEKHRKSFYAHLRSTGEPLTYYSDYRGLLTTRTAWDPDAAFLYFEPRNVPGGHTFDSRNDFVFASHGRLWSTRGTFWGAEGGSDRRSVILVDGKGQGHQCLPGKTLELVDSEQATFCAGDATMAYSYRAGKKSDPLYMDKPNDSRLVASKLPWMDLPWGELPGWLKGDKGGDRHSRISPHNPVEYAYRTVGLVKGSHPYLVLADDLKKDESSHRYDWLMQLPLDVSLLKSGIAGSGPGEIILGDDTGRRLKILVFTAGDNFEELKAAISALKLDRYEWFHHKTAIPSARLVLPLNSVNGRFRMVMIPFLEGQDEPQCTWNGETSTAEIKVGGMTDRIRFQVGDGGRTAVTLDTGSTRMEIGSK